MDDEPRPPGSEDAPGRASTAGRRAGSAALVAAIVLLTGGIGYLHHRADEPKTSSAGRTVDLEAYYLGSTGEGQRLFSEAHVVQNVTATDLQAAITAALGTPDDPDYRSGFPPGTQAAAVDTGGHIVIDFTSRTVAGSAPAGGDALMALQALVWTADAAVGHNEPVRFEIEGQPADTLLGRPARPSYTRGSPDSTLSPVSLVLEEGAELARGSLVYGEADAKQGLVTWKLLQGVQVVRHGFVSTGRSGTQARFELRIDAPPGSYTFEVSDTDGSGSGVSSDTKDIQVQ